MYWCLCVYKIFFIINFDYGRCYCHDHLADVLSIYCGICCATALSSCVADGKPLQGVVTLENGWQMFLPMWQMENNFKEWQMLIASFGRWNSQIVRWQMSATVADGIATGSTVFCCYYFNLNSVMLNKTSSHMWGRWYLPMFLFRDGLLTLMYIDSFQSATVATTSAIL